MAESPRRRILAVSYYFPPNPQPGSHRWESLARTLRELGHEVTVVTTSAFGSLETDDPWVIRTGDLQAQPALRRLLRRPSSDASDGPASGTVGSDDAPEPSRLFTRGLVPDSWIVTWLPYLIPTVRRLLKECQIDVLVTNSPPDSTHLLGLALGRNRPAWIADFDDGWRYEPVAGPWPTSIQERLDDLLERRVARSADALTAIGKLIALDLAERHGALTGDIPNGWDPGQLDLEVASAAPVELPSGVVNLVHTGVLSHPERRDPRGLFRALELLAAHDPSTAERLRLTLAGPLTSEDRQLLDSLSPAARTMVRQVGFLPRASALALQRAADVLLLISTGAHRQVVTAKLSEYLLAGRPILAVLSENEAARIVRETNTGIVVAPDDIDGLREALQSCVDGRLAASYAPRGLERYIQPAPAHEFAAVIEAAIARHRGAQGTPRAGRHPRRR